MQFDSATFILFLIAVVAIYHRLGLRGRRALLLCASYGFYWVWSIPFSLLLVASTVVDWGAALAIERLKAKVHRRLALAVSLLVNLGLLALFKYADFVSVSILDLVGMQPWPVLDWVLPLGISFYTFQTISYTVDVYRGTITAKRSLMDVALYVSFFPQLVAGPIVRSDVLMPQLARRAELDWDGLRRGIALVVWGLAKKVYVADTMGLIANEAYGDVGAQSGLGLLSATYAFAIQIYCDFSAYSDIAIGSALMLGIRLPENFARPYLACSVREFWRRWHISLSTWLRDYVYIPLGGGRKGPSRTSVNLMITMLLGGLWHGAGWHWIAWGGLQGVAMTVERATGVSTTAPARLAPRVLRIVLVFHFTCASWVLFRAANLGEAWTVLSRIATLAPGDVPVNVRPVIAVLLVMGAMAIGARERFVEAIATHATVVRWLSYAMITLFLMTFARVSGPEFIYFQF